MGFVASSVTVSATAYLTERGRELLFTGNRFDSSGDDLFAIVEFTLGDPDMNYRTTALLETGDVPDVSGKNEDCIKGTSKMVQNTFLVYQGTIPNPAAVPIYSTTNIAGNNLTININAL